MIDISADKHQLLVTDPKSPILSKIVNPNYTVQIRLQTLTSKQIINLNVHLNCNHVKIEFEIRNAKMKRKLRLPSMVAKVRR